MLAKVGQVGDKISKAFLDFIHFETVSLEGILLNLIGAQMEVDYTEQLVQ